MYRFGPFRLDVGGRLLFRNDKRIPLASKSFDILAALVEGRGTPVERGELLQRVWPDTAVEEGSLTSQISLLRKTLAPGPGSRRYIETLPKHGYRFVAPVEESSEARPPFEERRVMLAVLPFEHLSGAESHDYFSDGLTEEMITHLGQWNPERLGVIARTSSMRYKGTEKTIHQIGRELGVSYLLEGSVRRSGRRVRITAQLIQVKDQTHLWAKSYERDLGDLLHLQSDVARAVAKEIEIKLAPSEPALARTSAIAPEAYEDYWKGRYLWSRRTLESLQKSVRSFEAAIRREPQYAAAYSGLADALLTLGDDGLLPPREATGKARSAAAQALRIHEGLAEAHVSLAHAAFHDFRWVPAEREFRRSIELNPSYAPAHFYYANLLAAGGRIDEAIAEARSALRLDPVSAAAGTNVASILNHAGRSEEAADQAGKVLEIDPTFARAFEELGKAHGRQGRHAEALAALRNAVEWSGRSTKFVASLGHACAAAGKTGEARELLDELRQTSTRAYVSPFAFALVLVGLGDRNEAFAWLEKAYGDRSSALPFLAVDPRLGPLHADPRFGRLLRRLGLTQSERRGR